MRAFHGFLVAVARPSAALAQSEPLPEAPNVVAPPTGAEAPSEEPPAVVTSVPDDRDGWAMRPTALVAHLGGGTPLGAFGLAIDHSLLPQLSVGAGVGAGSGPDNSSHLHGAVMAHARPGQGEENAFVVGAAYSFGNYSHRDWEILGNPPTYWALNAQWAQAELGWEHRGKSGLVLGVTLGGAWLLNPGALKCTEATPTGSGWFSSAEPCETVTAESLVTMDFTAGYAF